MEILKLQRNVSMTVREGFDRFIRVKKAKNLSPDTISHYEIDFRYFSEFFDVSQTCDTITIDTYYSSVITIRDMGDENL